MLLKKSTIVCFFAYSMFTLAVSQNETTPRLPDTPAGRQIAGYLKAFNSGDSKTLREYMAKNDARTDLDASAESATEDKVALIMKDLGTLEVFRVEESKDHRVSLIAKTRKGKWIWIWCEVELAAPHKITGFRLEPTAPPD